MTLLTSVHAHVAMRLCLYAQKWVHKQIVQSRPQLLFAQLTYVTLPSNNMVCACAHSCCNGASTNLSGVTFKQLRAQIKRWEMDKRMYVTLGRLQFADDNKIFNHGLQGILEVLCVQPYPLAMHVLSFRVTVIHSQSVCKMQTRAVIFSIIVNTN